MSYQQSQTKRFQSQLKGRKFRVSRKLFCSASGGPWFKNQVKSFPCPYYSSNDSPGGPRSSSWPDWEHLGAPCSSLCPAPVLTASPRRRMLRLIGCMGRATLLGSLSFPQCWMDKLQSMEHLKLLSEESASLLPMVYCSWGLCLPLIQGIIKAVPSTHLGSVWRVGVKSSWCWKVKLSHFALSADRSLPWAAGVGSMTHGRIGFWLLRMLDPNQISSSKLLFQWSKTNQNSYWKLES